MNFSISFHLFSHVMVLCLLSYICIPGRHHPFLLFMSKEQSIIRNPQLPYHLLELWYFLIIKKDGNRNFLGRAHFAIPINDGVLLEKRGQWLLDRQPALSTIKSLAFQPLPQPTVNSFTFFVILMLEEGIPRGWFYLLIIVLIYITSITSGWTRSHAHYSHRMKFLRTG